MAQRYKNYVDGKWSASETDETFEVRNPAGTEEVVATVQNSSAEDANDAVKQQRPPSLNGLGD